MPDRLACLACGATTAEPWAVGWDAEYRTSNDRFTYHRCRVCEALFIEPVPRERLAEIYPPNYYSFGSFGGTPVHRLKEWLDARLFRWVLGQLGGARLAVLDVGGGAGQQLSLVRRLDSRIARTVVVDLADGVAAAHRRGHEFVRCRIEEFESDARFDLVLLLNLIEHVEAPGAVLAKLAGLLAPDGVVLVKTPNHASFDARLFRHANWGGYHCPRHWVLFTRRSFTRLAEHAGLTVRWFHYTQGAPFWSTSVLFALARLGWIAVSRERPAVYHPLYPPLAAIFGAFDLLRSPFAPTSQMFFLLGRMKTHRA